MDSKGVVDLAELVSAADVADVNEEVPSDDGVGIEEILWQYKEAIIDLHNRVTALESRPQFAASIRGRRTGH